MPDAVKDLVIRLGFEHGDTRQQIGAIKTALNELNSGLAASAAVAAGFSGTLNQVKAESAGLKESIALQKQMIEKYGEAIDKANENLKRSTEAYDKHKANLEDLRSKEADLIQQKEALKAAMDAEKAAAGDNSMAYLEMDARMDELNAALRETQSAIDGEEQALNRSERAINRNAQTVSRLTTQQNNARAALAGMEDRLRSHAVAWEAAAAAADRFGDSARTAGERQEKLGQKLSNVSGAILGLGYAASDAAIAWESSFAGVRKTVNGTEEDLQGIEDALLGMQVPTDFDELADIAANAGQLGIATENVVGFTRTMADLAETTDLTADAAASSFAQYANITGMPQESIARLGSVTVELGNNLATTESKIVAFAQAIGAAGSQAGMTDQQIFGISGGLASLGLEAQAGGTAFSRALIAMKVAAETGNDDLKAFAKVAGMSASEFKTAFGQDAAGTFIRFVQGLSSGSESAIVMLDKMGITETRLRDMLLRSSNASQLLTRSVGLANQAWTENTALAKEAAVRYQTTESRMQMTGKQAQKVAMDFGKALMPALNQGLDGIQSIIDKFNRLDEAQRASIVKWAAYAAAVGPAVTVIGKANTALGNVAGGFANFARTMAESGGGLRSFATWLSTLLGPAGIAALVAGLGLAAYKLYDYASGAKAAREAQEALNRQAQAWADTQAATIYDTGTADPLARFGLSKDAFQTAEAASQDWMSSLTATWTDGKKETNAIVKQYADSFREGSDGVRDVIRQRAETLDKYSAMSPEAKAAMDKDLQDLDSYDKEVASLLKKRQNGTLTDEDQARLSEILTARTQIQMKYTYSADGYDQIITQMEAEIERLKALGQGGDPTLVGDTLGALAEGRKAYNQALDASYASEYAQIATIEDEAAKQAALMDLNDRYNRQRQEGEDAYNDAVRKAGAQAMGDEGLKDQVDLVNQLVAALGSGEDVDIPAITELASGLDEGKLTSVISLMEQLKAAGMTDEERTAGFGDSLDGMKTKLEALRELTGDTEGLEGLAKAIGEALPQEIQRIMVGLDMTQAAADWAAFAEGGSLQPIVPKLGEIDASAAVVTGTILADGVLGTVTGADGKTYKVTGATVNADGTLASVTAEDGTTYTVTDGDVQADGTLASVTGADGRKYTVTGVSAAVDGELGTVTGADGRTYKVTGATVNADGTLASVTAENGTTYTVNGASVTVNGTWAGGTITGATASVTLNPLDQAAVDAWKVANAGVQLDGPPAKVGVKLGATWKSDLEGALAAGLVTVTSNGVPVTVTPEVLSQVTAQDVALVGEDGTIHVIITPELGTPDGVEQADAAMNQNPNAGTILAPLSSSTQEKLDQIRQASQAVDEFNQKAKEAKDGGDLGLSQMFDDAAAESARQLQTTVEGLSDADLSNIGGQIMNLMAALESGQGTPEELAAYQAQLEQLLAFVETIDPEQYNATGENVMGGIAAGMNAYGWTGDANGVAGALKSAVDAALGVASPATTMIPTGTNVAAGIGQGMSGYSFTSDAAAVKSGITGSFSDLQATGVSAGGSFSAGLASGITAGRSGVIEAAKRVAAAAAKAAKDELDINSPSRVTEGFGEMFDLGFVRGVENAMPRISRAVERALYVQPQQAAAPVYNSTTDRRDMSVTNAINVAHMEVRDDTDIQSVSRELDALTRREQRMVGAR